MIFLIQVINEYRIVSCSLNRFEDNFILQVVHSNQITVYSDVFNLSFSLVSSLRSEISRNDEQSFTIFIRNQRSVFSNRTQDRKNRTFECARSSFVSIQLYIVDQVQTGNDEVMISLDPIQTFRTNIVRTMIFSIEVFVDSVDMTVRQITETIVYKVCEVCIRSNRVVCSHSCDQALRSRTCCIELIISIAYNDTELSNMVPRVSPQRNITSEEISQTFQQCISFVIRTINNLYRDTIFFQSSLHSRSAQIDFDIQCIGYILTTPCRSSVVSIACCAPACFYILLFSIVSEEEAISRLFEAVIFVRITFCR